MPNFLKLVGNSFVGLGILTVLGAGDASAVSRDTATTSRDTTPAVTRNTTPVTGASGRGTMAMVARMPSMPTLPGGSIGNVTENLPSDNTPNTQPDTNNPGNPGTPDNPDNPDKPDNPDRPDRPNRPDHPNRPPRPECPDGGVRDSEYTVEQCMNDVQSCVNASLPAGLASMYNEDLRNSIVNGMGLCQVQVERCVTEVRRDCRNIYRSDADVWIDFNARRVQPEYYNFVLRKTGLTPHQAENTCLLLDVNTYGSSFTAVANSGNTTAEYNDRVGAYNKQQGNVLIKKNPLGAKTNYGNPGVDGARGHYARWDASTADCYLRVAAYNKDTHIKNSWLFGAIGNDEPAEVWRTTGDTFTCNKDLFGFSLMNNTKTAAALGIGGGTLLGAGIGALAGHGRRAFDCTNDKHREMLLEQLHSDGSMIRLSNYLSSGLPAATTVLAQTQCEEILDLYDRYAKTKQALTECGGLHGTVAEYDHIHVTASGPDAQQLGHDVTEGVLAGIAQLDENSDVTELNKKCGTFPSLNLAQAYGRDVYSCNGPDGICRPAYEIATQVASLDGIITDDLITLIEKGEKSNMGKSIGIGAAVGAGTGGLATGIVALVEHNNINCRLGDGLAQVGMGKSYSIGSLRDFYVKWNLNLPDTIAPTADINDCQSWRTACSKYTYVEDCKGALMNYRPTPNSPTTLIRSACTPSGSLCVENYPVAKSYGVCE